MGALFVKDFENFKRGIMDYMTCIYVFYKSSNNAVNKFRGIK